MPDGYFKPSKAIFGNYYLKPFIQARFQIDCYILIILCNQDQRSFLGAIIQTRVLA